MARSPQISNRKAYDRSRSRTEKRREQNRKAGRKRRSQPGWKHRVTIYERYGLSLVRYLATVHFQDEKCAICRTPFALLKGKHNPVNIDHCHQTLQVRGALCHHCNVMLGGAKDNPMTLVRAVNYLKECSPWVF